MSKVFVIWYLLLRFTKEESLKKIIGETRYTVRME